VCSVFTFAPSLGCCVAQLSGAVASSLCLSLTHAGCFSVARCCSSSRLFRLAGLPVVPARSPSAPARRVVRPAGASCRPFAAAVGLSVGRRPRSSVRLVGNGKTLLGVCVLVFSLRWCFTFWSVFVPFSSPTQISLNTRKSPGFHHPPSPLTPTHFPASIL